MHGHLRARMQRQRRHDFPGQPGHAKILYQHGIRPRLIQEAKIVRQFCQFLIIHNSIHCHMDMYTPQMGKADGFPQALRIKIIRIGPRPKAGACQIDRIRPALYRCPEGLPASRRR